MSIALVAAFPRFITGNKPLLSTLESIQPKDVVSRQQNQLVAPSTSISTEDELAMAEVLDTHK
mgnify:CR=1 FL=1